MPCGGCWLTKLKPLRVNGRRCVEGKASFLDFVGAFLIAEELARAVLSLPLVPHLLRGQAAFACEEVLNSLGGLSP